MSKIYTKTGDDGSTALTNGKRVKKTNNIIELYGELDELNSFLGFAAEAFIHNANCSKFLPNIYRVQKDLFKIASEIVSGNKINVSVQLINQLEGEIDLFDAQLPILKSFILPGGGEIASRLHLVRSVCRRAERAAFKVLETTKHTEVVAMYLNRLSDWLFVLARYVAFLSNIEEFTI